MGKALRKLGKWIRPNQVTALGVAATAGGLGLMQSGNAYVDGLGLLLVAGSYAVDMLDGKMAREKDLDTGLTMQTAEGAIIDPMADKARDAIVWSPITYSQVMAGNYFLPITVAVNFGVDTVSHLLRGGPITQLKSAYRGIFYPKLCKKDTKENPNRAKLYGKTKTVIRALAAISYLTLEWYWNHAGEISNVVEEKSNVVLGSALLVAAACGTIGVCNRFREKRRGLEKMLDD